MRTHPPPSPLKLLVVDDEADMRRLIRFALGARYDVLEAGTAGEALRLAGLMKPAVVLLDVVLPDMNGLEVLRALRAIDPAVGVIMLTGDDRMDVASAALRCGASSYVTKPFDPDALCREIDRLAETTATRAARSDLPWRVGGVQASGPRRHVL